jgi:hypothetical protein
VVVYTRTFVVVFVVVFLSNSMYILIIIKQGTLRLAAAGLVAEHVTNGRALPAEQKPRRSVPPLVGRKKESAPLTPRFAVLCAPTPQNSCTEQRGDR